jgi:hypothetical protein
MAFLGGAGARIGRTKLLVVVVALFLMLAAAPNALAANGSIKGTVTDNSATPKPLPDIEVALYDTTGDFIDETSTATDGTYSFSEAPGTYRVGFTDFNGVYAPQYYNNQTSLSSANPVTVASGATASNVNAKMVKGANITGKVTNSASTGLSGIEVQLYDNSGNFITATSTASDGTYTFAGQALAAGTYKVGFTDFSGTYLAQFYNNKPTLASATPITLAASATAANINAKLITGGIITGTVTNSSSTAQANIDVSLFDSSGNFVDSTQTASNGTYSFGGLQTGSYRVGFEDENQVYLSQFYNDKPTLASATPISVTAGSTASNINAKLITGGKITGTVTNSSSTGLANIDVEVFSSSGAVVGEVFTASDGTYTVGGLATGGYRVDFNPTSSTANVLGQFYNNKPNLLEATPISVTAAGTVANINAKLATGGQITGKVTGPTRTALANVAVTVYDTAGDPVGGAVTTSTGVYDVTGLRTGHYEVGYFDETGQFPQRYYNGAFSVGTATPIAVTAGSSTANINQSLSNPGTLSGVVTDASTKLSGIDVAVFDAGGDEVAETSTDSTGTYTISGLNAGAYEVEFVDPSGKHKTVWYTGKPSIVTANPVDVAAGGSTQAGQKMTSITTPPPPSTGAISGTVTDSSSDPLANAVVSIYDSSGNFFAEGFTDSTGKYTVTGLPSGKYKVGFSDFGNFLTQYYNNQPTLAKAAAVTVTAPKTTANINAKLAAGGQITGTVTNSSSTPQSGIDIEVFDSSGNVVGDASTGQDGTYDVDALATGSYKVGFNLDNDGFNPYLPQYYKNKTTLASATAVAVTAGSTKSAISAKLSSGGVITGTVTDSSTSSPLQSAEVDLYNASGNLVASTGTAANGTYSFAGLPTASYKVGFEAGDYLPQFYNNESTLASATAIAVTAGATKSGINAKLVLAGTITGTVTDANSYPLLDIAVSVYNSSGISVAFTETGTDGSYSIAGLPAGTYRVGFTANAGGAVNNFLPQFYNDKTTLASATSVSVAAGKTINNINAKLVTAGQITGTVTDVARHPLSSVDVTIYNSSDTEVAETDTTPGGTYAVSGLPAGTYEVGFDTEDGAAYNAQFYNGKSSISTATPVTVSSGATTANINGLLSGGGQISGTVTDAETNAAISGVTVDVYNASGVIIADATTGAAGSFTATKLDTGSYHVAFVAAGFVTQFYNNQTSLKTATSVSVKSGSTATGINAKLQTAGQIAGTVTNAASKAVSGVTVTVYDSDGNTVATTTTSSAGTYTVPGLTPGTSLYRVGFQATGYVGQFYNNEPALASANTVSVTAAATTSNVNAKLVATGSISGTVTNSSSAAVAGATVTAYNSSGTAVGHALTNASGVYTITGLTPGTSAYRVEFVESGLTTQFYNDKTTLAGADKISVTAGSTTTGISAKLT